MNVRTRLKTVVYVMLLGWASLTQAAETFPTKPVHLIVPAAPGGSIDVVSRLIADKMGEYLGQPVIVDTRAGAETLLGTSYVKNQPADGYTIIAHANGFLTMSAVRQDPGYDPLKDFTGIGLMQTSPMIIETGASQPDKTFDDFVARAKAAPGKLTFASVGGTSPSYLVIALALQKAGVQATHVLYRGNGAALPDVAGGRVNLICDGYVSSQGYFSAGTLRPLAVSGKARLSSLPDVPTLKEQGIDFSYTLWLGLLARSGTPDPVIQRLSDALHYATSSKDIVDRFHREGSEPGLDTPAQFNAFLAGDMAASLPQILSLHLEKQ